MCIFIPTLTCILSANYTVLNGNRMYGISCYVQKNNSEDKFIHMSSLFLSSSLLTHS